MGVSRTIVAAVVAALVAGALAAPQLAGAADTNKDVRVINTASEPVPVTGTVAIGNTPTMNVGNTPTVDVANSAGDPLFVQETGGATETRVQQFITAFNSSMGGEDCGPVEVPPGKTLRIETVSIEAIGATDPIAYLKIDHLEGALISVHILGDEFVPTGSRYSAVYHGPLFATEPGVDGDSVYVCAGAETEVRAFVTGYMLN